MKYSFTLLVILIINFYTFSQDQSPTFLEISNSNLTKNEKIAKFDSLLNTYKNKNNLDLWFKETLEVAKWCRSNRRTSKALIYTKVNVHRMDSVKYKDKAFLRRNLYALGFYQRRKYNFDEAITNLKRALEYETLDRYAISSAIQLGELYFSIGQYHKSKEYHELGKSLSKQLNLEKINNNYVVMNDIGIGIACKLINTDKSLKYGVDILSSAIEFSNRVNNDEDPKNNVRKRHVYTLYNQLGNIYIDRVYPNFEKGKINLDKALIIAKELYEEDERRISYVGNTYNDIGVLYLKAEREEAKSYFEKALTYKPIPVTKSVIHRNLSIHHLFFKNYDKAFEHIQTSLHTLVDFDSTNVKNLPSKVNLIDSKLRFQLISGLTDKALIWTELAENFPENKSYIDEALKTFELADFLVEQTRIDSKELKSKLFWRKTATENYIGATKASFLANDHEKAYYFIEKNKALLLLEDVTLKMSRTNSEIPDDIVEQELNLKNEIAKLEELLITKQTDSIQSLLLLTKDDYNKYINDLDPKYRFHFKTQKPAKVIDLKVFKSKFLNNDNAYIEYILNDEEGFGILITKDITEVFEIKECENLKEITKQYRSFLEQPFLDKAAIKEYNTVSNAIYETLFPDNIKTLIKGKKLTILADYYLQNIPFEALQTSATEKSYLIYQNEVNYAYSLSFLNENNKIERTNTTNLVGFAPVEFSEGLIALPNTEEELNLISDLFSSNMYLKTDATKERFFADSKNAKIIHIASHADANDSISPWIAFHNSKVDLKELYNFNNTADLVVLSACNTSLGELNKGEGVMSLSRSFFNTGSHSVLPTLWEVNDKTSAELLHSFYQNIQLGQNKSLALHNAKLDYLKTSAPNQALPYYWASFVLIGDAGEIEISNGLPAIYYYIPIAILLIIIVLFFRRKKIKGRQNI